MSAVGLPGFEDRDLTAVTDLSWTDDRVELLKKLWMDGLSSSQIANELGGVTRNAVIARCTAWG